MRDVPPVITSAASCDQASALREANLMADVLPLSQLAKLTTTKYIRKGRLRLWQRKKKKH